MIIYVQKPADKAENRAPLTPSAAKKLIDLGMSIEMPAGTGEKSGHSDQQFIDEGVTITKKPDESLAKADIVFGLEIPKSTYFKKMKEGAIYLGRVEPFGNANVIKAAAKAKVRLVLSLIHI